MCPGAKTTVLAALSVVLMGTAAGAVELAAHRAVYDLALDRSREMADGAVNMKGRMVYEFTGSACEGYTVNFRFVIETQDQEDNSTVTDLRTSNHETADETAFQFLSQTYTNQVLTEDVKGSASRSNPETLDISLSSPERRDIRLGRNISFPTAQLRRIIEAAERGDRVLNMDVYDGSDGGQHAFRTSTIIGDERKTPPDANEAAIGNLRRWPVVVSYFDAETAGDLTPDYSISFDLWENGVSTKMTMDYGDFVLKGDIGQYQSLAKSDCPATATGAPPPATDAPAEPVAPATPADPVAPAAPATP